MKGKPRAVPSHPLSMGSHRACGATWVGGGKSPRGSRGAGGAVGEEDEQEQSMRFGYGDAITRPLITVYTNLRN